MRLLATILFVVLCPAPACAVLIDQFDGEQSPSPGELSMPQTFVGPGIIGSERDIRSFPSLNDEAQVEIDAQGSSALSVSMTSSLLLVTWDGINIPDEGFGRGFDAVDFTEAGTHDAIAIRVLSTNLPFQLTLYVNDTSDTGNYRDIVLPGQVDSPQTFYVPFELFDPQLDFSSIDEVALFLNVGTSDELQIDWIATALVPEPSSGVLVVFAMVALAGFGWRRRKLSSR